MTPFIIIAILYALILTGCGGHAADAPHPDARYPAPVSHVEQQP